VAAPVGVKGFTVDAASRRDVLSFYHAVYGASDGFEARSEWTGDVAGLLPGSTSLALKNDVLRRVNFYRALAGVPANLSLNLEKSVKAQEAALIAARNLGLSHHPVSEYPEWAGLSQLPLGVEASAKSNLSLGAYGPDAVDGQIRDDGEANWQVGHRRWLLSLQQVEIGTGDVPEQAGFSAANAIWVVGESGTAVPAQFVLWPNQGFTPVGLLPARWSVSHPGADFGGASVSMSRDGAPVPVRVTSISSTPADSVQGEPTLVWEPVLAPSVGSGDAAYSVQVSGIKIGGVTRSLAYTVVAFDPTVLGETLSITGAASVTTAGGPYAFNSIAQADGYELTVARASAAAWLEGAEGPAVQISTDTAPGYAVVQTQVAGSGTGAFHLTHPGATAAGFADQAFQLKRRLVPGPDSVLQFTETGRFAETTTTLNAEVSTDDGLTWTAVWSRAGVGLNSARFDAGWNPHAVSLGAYSGRAVLLRFRLKGNGGPVAVGTTKDHGFYVDNILLTNGVELVDARLTTLSSEATGFVLNSATAGAHLMEGNSYYLSVVPRVGTRLFPPGALKVATVPLVSAMAAAAPPVGLPSILVQPLEMKVAAGSPAEFSVLAVGGGTLRYQWRKNGVAVAGATAAVYRIESAQRADESSQGTTGYDVVVTGDSGSVTSARVGLTVVEGGAFITGHPAGKSLKLGESYTMRVTTAEPEVTYQWRKNGVAIVGGTAASFSLSKFEAANAGRYDVVVRNPPFGDVHSTPAYLGVASKVVPNFQKATYDWITLAGSGQPGSANGTGTAAQFNGPASIVVDGQGTLYVSDRLNHVIRRVTQSGVVTTVAGSLSTDEKGKGTVDGAALSTARLDSPEGLAIDKVSGALYFAEPNSNTVRKLTNPGQSNATVSTVAGAAGQFYVAGGLNTPWKVAVDPSGSLYVLDLSSIRKVISINQFTLLFGELPETYSGTQPGPMAMTVDSSGKIFAAATDGGEFKIFSRVAGGSFTTTNYGPYPFPITDLALGGGTNLYAANESSVELLGDISQSSPASGLPASLTNAISGYAAPSALAVDADGTVYAVDPFQNTVIRGVPSGLPVFLSHPAGGKGEDGVPLTLSASALGPGAIAYQWFRDGVAIGGATQASYTMASGGSGAGVYTVEASNTAGIVTSSAATVEGSSTTFAIVTQPQAREVVLGAAVTLEVGWRGPSQPTFQWYRNNVAVSGATSALYSFSAVRGSDAGDYKVVLKSGTVTLTSNTVKLTVHVPASIFAQPEDVAAALETSVTLKVSATGTPPLTYQWYKDDVLLSGGTSAVYSIAAVKEGDKGAYRVEVSNIAASNVRSESAVVSVLIRPTLRAELPALRALNLGSAATFSMNADGSQPLSYQWRKDGVPIEGGTAATLGVAVLKESDAGSYDVLVSNRLGTVVSNASKLTVNLPAKILSQPPASISATIGAAVPLSVVAGGTGPFTYEWRQNGLSLEGGTSATYLAPTLEAGSARYVVSVKSLVFGNTVESAGTVVNVSPGRGISILRAPTATTSLIKGTAAGVKITVDPNPSDALRTTYRLFTQGGSGPGVDVGIGGLVPANGEFEVPLRSLTAGGSFAVVLSREYANGQVISGVETPAFAVELKGIDAAAGTYELLLTDANGLVGDGATYRGVVQATVSKTGSVSGRVLYNEAPLLSDALGSERAYTAVVRSFSSVFTPSAADPGRLVCAPKLGLGTQANRQALELELDFSGTPVELNAVVRDRISVPPETDPEGCVSQGFGAVRGVTSLTEKLNFTSLVGRYALGSDSGSMHGSGPGADNNATVLAQVLTTGKVLWATRLSGFTGSGSATLSTTEQAAATAQFYQARTLSTTKALSTNSLLGQLRFDKIEGGSLWSAKVAAAYDTDKLERQSCYITKVAKPPEVAKLPVYNGELFDVGIAGSPAFNWSGVQLLDFQAGTSCRWTGATTAGLLSFLNPASASAPTSIPPLYLIAEDPAGDGTYVWTITVSASGTVKATNYSATDLQPTLTLRLDKTRGEWLGSYVSPVTKQRRTVAGVLARPESEDSLRGAGWVELGTIPATRTGGWRLELNAP
jgi:hypothetical protein